MLRRSLGRQMLALRQAASGALSSECAWATPAAQIMEHPSFLAPVSSANHQWSAWRGYKVQGNEIRAGQVLEIDGKLFQVMKQEYTQGQGRQLGNVHLVMKDILSGSQKMAKLRPAESMEVVRLEDKTYNFLYREDDIFFMMDPETFEQISMDLDKLGDVAKYLEEGSEVKISFHQGEPITGSLPSTVTLEIAEADPSIKGESAAGGSKGAIASTGLQVKVPLYINKGDRAVIDTSNGQFVRRA